MLIKFEVENLMGFEKPFVFDLTTSKRYNYNQDLLNKKIITKALVYGPNGSGKSTLCWGLMDITYHLADKEKQFVPNELYFNGNSLNEMAKFAYTFKFDNKIVRYEYTKSSQTALLYEKLYYDDKLVFEYNYTDPTHNLLTLPELGTLKLENLPQQLSSIKYIYNNTIQEVKSPIYKIIDFVNRMLLFKTLTEGNFYIGYSNGNTSLSSIIIKHNKVKEFKMFLEEQGLYYNIIQYTELNGTPNIGVKFKSGKIIPLAKIASSGTMTIWLFYCWMLEFNNISLLIIDEFDAYYHYKTAQAIIKLINQYKMQAVITTHNLMLMDNAITRPDCCFILDNNKIKSLGQLSAKEIRSKNNLRKMYIDGVFSEFFPKK